MEQSVGDAVTDSSWTSSGDRGCCPNYTTGGTLESAAADRERDTRVWFNLPPMTVWQLLYYNSFTFSILFV